MVPLLIKKGGKGDYAFLFDRCNADVLVFGSSRAYRHYNPLIIKDSLGLSCYNCGESGMGFIHNYAIFHEMTSRYKPKLVIYDINPPIDIINDHKDKHMYLKGLKPYHDKEGVKAVLNAVDKFERYKTLSNLYCYNSDFDIDNERSYCGYIPTNKKFDKTKVRIGERLIEREMDMLKLYFANLFVNEAVDKNIHIILCISPRWYGLDKYYVEKVQTICKQHNIPFFDYSNNSKYVHNNDYFSDGLHMNGLGADEFTRDLVHVLKINRVID